MRTRFFLLAAVLLILSVAGFVAPRPIFGVLETTPLLNAVHCLAAAVAAVAASRGIRTMRTAGQLLGYLFAALATTAFITDASRVNDLLPLTTSNAWVHLVLALVFLYHALLAPPTL